MTVYVDNAFIPARVRNGGRYITGRWCHMFSDASDDELHALADRIGLRRSWFQHADDPIQHRRHYDVTESRRAAALAAGAVEISVRDMGRMIGAERTRLRELSSGAAS